jgi:putative flippase GtrA
MKRITDLISFLYQHKLIRYLFVGGTTFIIDEGLLIVFHGALKLWLPLALLVAYSVAFVYNFTLNRNWAFSGAENKSMREHIKPYALLFIFNLLFTVLFVSLVSHVINYAVAKPIAVLLQTTWTYFIYKNIIFADEKPTSSTKVVSESIQ